MGVRGGAPAQKEDSQNRVASFLMQNSVNSTEQRKLNLRCSALELMH